MTPEHSRLSLRFQVTGYRQGIKQLLISFGSIFPLFSDETSRAPCL